MNKKLQDYDKCLVIISSCTNSQQNNVAYAVCQQFEKTYGKDAYSKQLFELCDENLINIVSMS